MISVLCPSRLRAESLFESVGSLLHTAEQPDDVEVLIAVDPDDVSDYYRFEHRCIVLRAPQRYGYRQLHRYYNVLAREAKGEWLFLWNDDARMKTGAWDRIVSRFPQDRVLSPDNPHRPIPAFPIVPRRFVEALGHFSLGPHCDIWWQELAAKGACAVEWIDVRVEHLRPDIIGTPADSVHDERGFWLHEFYEPGMQAMHDADCEVIRAMTRIARNAPIYSAPYPATPSTTLE
jgi:hypothetical protein